MSNINKEFDKELFIAILQNLLSLNVESFSIEDGSPKEFCDKFCYNEIIQPLFTYSSISNIIEYARENIFYEIQDKLSIHILILLIEKQVFLLGPFINTTISNKTIKNILLDLKLPSAFESSIKLYANNFPIETSYNIQKTANAILQAMGIIKDPCVYEKVTTPKLNTNKNSDLREETFDYQTITRRYELENKFLQAIEKGDVDNVMKAYQEMASNGSGIIRNVNAIYSNPDLSTAVLRGLVRKAAERGGVPVTEINDITQSSVQRQTQARSQEEIYHITSNMIIELTKAVKNHQLNTKGLSSPIIKVVNYIQNNNSQKISLEDLSNIANYSVGHLSKEFKKEVGMTISDYIQLIRCQKAKELLETTDAQISNISYIVGYEDNNYFVKVFKKQYGVTPSAYRKSLIK